MINPDSLSNRPRSSPRRSKIIAMVISRGRVGAHPRLALCPCWAPAPALAVVAALILALGTFSYALVPIHLCCWS